MSFSPTPAPRPINPDPKSNKESGSGVVTTAFVLRPGIVKLVGLLPLGEFPKLKVMLPPLYCLGVGPKRAVVNVGLRVTFDKKPLKVPSDMLVAVRDETLENEADIRLPETPNPGISQRVKASLLDYRDW